MKRHTSLLALVLYGLTAALPSWAADEPQPPQGAQQETTQPADSKAADKDSGENKKEKGEKKESGAEPDCDQ